jgi:hypothetical protein
VNGALVSRHLEFTLPSYGGFRMATENEHEGGTRMRSRLTKLGAAVVALVALAVGGSALASASNHKAGPPAQARAAAQNPADNQSEAADSSTEAPSGAANTDNVQQGDQTGNDQADSQSESTGSESGSSDGAGAGGYADSNPNADTQQQGEN